MKDDIPPPLEAIAKAIGYQYSVDRDAAGPKAAHGAVSYRGVLIDSRWDIQAEYVAMRSIIDRLPDLIRVRVQSICCDSNCGANYVVTIKPARFCARLPAVVDEAIVAIGGGHNGVLIESDDPEGSVMLDPSWDESWDE